MFSKSAAETWLLVVLMTFVLAGSSYAGQAPADLQAAEMLIWGGGKTQEEAHVSLYRYYEAIQQSPEWRDVMTLTPTFPRVMESNTVPGLKPGFVIVVLGVCAAPDAAAAAKYLKAIEPGVYSRPVSWSEKSSDGKLPCPVLLEGWSFYGVERARSSAGELTGALFLQNELTEGAEFEFKRWKAFFTLRGPKNDLQTRLVDVSRSDVSVVKTFKAGAAGIVLDEEYVDPLCTGAPEFKQYSRTRTYSSSGGEIRAADLERLIKQGPCRYPETGNN